jgi:hypothetical protein
MMTKQTTKGKTKSLRGIENCRVVDIGIGNFAECLKAGPATCSHALPFGYCFLCMHPHVDEIIENTKNQMRKVALKS